MSGYGDAGVERLIELLKVCIILCCDHIYLNPNTVCAKKGELEMCMRLMGAPTVADIKREMVDIRNIKDHFVANPTDYLAHGAYERMHPRGNWSKL